MPRIFYSNACDITDAANALAAEGHRAFGLTDGHRKKPGSRAPPGITAAHALPSSVVPGLSGSGKPAR
ncbi:hypothetical protein, partial [Acrocarpospora corrugata]